MTAARDPSTPATAASGMEGTHVVGTLLVPEVAARHLERWDAIQTGFVEDPQASVAEADALVQAVISDIVGSFDAERQRLEQRWRADEEISTEDLRRALQRYRTFFTRLLET